MSENNEPVGLPNQNNVPYGSSNDYITKAAEACAAGDMVLGMHLYLAAYEKAANDPLLPEGAAVNSLRKAWTLACDLKERSMAEYVFEKLEPYLTGDEVSDCAEQLQRLALDRLEEFGFSRAELEDVAQMLSQDFMVGGAPLMHVERFTLPFAPQQFEETSEQPQGAFDQPDEMPGLLDSAIDQVAQAEDDGVLKIDAPFVNLEELLSAQQVAAPAAEGSDATAPASDGEASDQASAADQPDAPSQSSEQGEPSQPGNLGFISANDARLPKMPTLPQDKTNEPLSYRTLVGYDEAVATMRDYGVGLAGDQRFLNFVDMLNRRHGLDRMPALDSMLFRAVAREDAMRFVEATIGELGLPALRMSMEENFQGMPVLCVTANSENHPRMNQARNRFDGPGVLVIEDLDLWIVPAMPENAEGLNGLVMANMSRGAREAINMIRSAVEDPDVYVLVTASTNEEVDPFFYELLEPMTVVDIDCPTDSERSDIWMQIVKEHPSMRTLNRVDLVHYSQGMPRYDIYMAAREAVEEAYKLGLITRSYRAVTPQNIFEKLAAYQPLDSAEYKALESEVIKDFQHDLDHLEDLLDNPWE